jgi:Lon protease-like protein
VSERLTPLFPLENVVLFPRLQTPLHVFEPRYRQMTEAALAADGRIVMCVVRPETTGDMAGDPPVFPVACAGVIREHRRLPDGRFHILLQGSERVRILEEPARPAEQLYRSARVAALPDRCDAESELRIAAMRPRLIERVGELLGETEISPERFRDIDDPAFVNALCNALPLAPPEKQALLETDELGDRCARLIELVDFAIAAGRARRVPESGSVH